MRFFLEAEDGELAVKSDALIGELIKAFADEAPELAARLQKALPEKEPVELRMPVLRELHKRTAAAYEQMLGMMLKDISAVLDRSLHEQQAEKGFYDHTKPLADRDSAAYKRVCSGLKQRGFVDSDFEEGGSLYGLSTAELVQLLRAPDDDPMRKGAALFIGPRGGKWADAAHTVPWKPALVKPSERPKPDVKKLLEGNFGIPRIEMPQIASDKVKDFIADMEKDGVKVTRGARSVDTLKATQSEMHADKVDAMAHDPEARDALSKPIIVSNDGYLLDGHHRWAALHTLNPKSQIQTIEVDLPMKELLTRAKQFDGVEYKKSGQGFTEERVRELLKKGAEGADELNAILKRQFWRG